MGDRETDGFFDGVTIMKRLQQAKEQRPNDINKVTLTPKID